MKRVRRIAVAVAALLVSLAPVSAEVTPGAAAPAFELRDMNGKTYSLADFEGKYIVLEWTNYDCPFVRKHYSTRNMQELQREYVGKGVVWLTINSSAPGKQGNYSAEEWRKRVAEQGAKSTAVLLDADGKVGRLYGAKTTPHTFVIAPDGNIIYAGAIDSRPSARARDVKGATNYVRSALDNHMAGKPVKPSATRPYGCGVKY